MILFPIGIRYIDWIRGNEIDLFHWNRNTNESKQNILLSAGYEFRAASPKMFKFWFDFSHFWNLSFSSMLSWSSILGIWFRFALNLFSSQYRTESLTEFNIQICNAYCLHTAHYRLHIKKKKINNEAEYSNIHWKKFDTMSVSYLMAGI